MGSVDLGSVLARNAAVLWTSLDGEVVVYAPVSADVLVLNLTAGVLWECLDGVSPVHEILDDLAGAFGVERDVVAADCVPLLQSWVDSGLAHDPSVEPTPVAPSDVDATTETGAPARGSSRWGFLADPPNA